MQNNSSSMENAAAAKGKYKWIWTVVRIVIGLGLIAFLLLRLDFNKILQNIRGLQILYLLATLVPYFIFIVISAWRWQVLLDHKKINIPFSRTFVIYFISIFFSNVFPTTIGGDVMRVVYGIPGRRAESLAIVIVDRILGFLGLFIFALIWVLYLMISQHRVELLSFTIIGLAVLVLITYLLFSERVYSFFAPFFQKIRIFKFGERLRNLHKTMTDFGGAWRLITVCIVQSVFIQALLAVAPFLVLRGMGNHNVSILPFFLYVPIINVISMIPVSLNALGVRENAYVFFFARVGLDGSVSFAMSLVSFFMFFLLTLVGGVCFIFFRKGGKE